MPEPARVIQIRVTEEELATLRRGSELAYASLPDFIRKQLGLTKRPEARGKHTKHRGPRMKQAPLFGADTPQAPASSRRASDAAAPEASKNEEDERDAGE
jgi:hypothetical protein